MKPIPIEVACKVCTVVKTTAKDFYRNSDGRPSSTCKTCVKKQRKVRYEADPAAHNAKVAEWQAKNPDKVRVYKKKWSDEHPTYEKERYQAHRDKVIARSAAWKRANPERARAWFVANRERMREHDRRRYYGKDRAKRLVNAQVQSSRRKARIRGNGGMLSVREWNETLNYFGNRCAYCMALLEKPTIDHIVPLSRGGRHDQENVVPACAKCNFGKRTTSLLDLLVAGKAA